MSRYLSVALACAVVCLVMAPTRTALADSTEFVPPENGVTNLYQAMTPNTALTEMTKDELTALAEKCFAGEPEKSSRVMDDGVHEYWKYMWNVKGGREEECHVELTVTLVKDRVTGTMYMAQKGGAQPATPAKDDEAKMNEPKNPCRELWNELKLGMTTKEFEELAAKHGFTHKVQKNESGEESWGAAWWKYHKDDPTPPPQDAWQWQTMIDVKFSDGRVTKADYAPLTYPEIMEKK